MIHKFSFLLVLLFMVACNNNLQVEQQKCRALIQKEIENSPYFFELIALEKHLIKYKLLVENEKENYYNLMLKLLHAPSSVHATLNLYNYNYQYNLDLKNDCQHNSLAYSDIREIHQELYDKLNHNPSEENLLKFKEFIENNYKNLDKNFIRSKTFNYITLHQLYTSSLKSKINLLNTLNLNITTNNLFIEDKATTISTLKQDLELVIQKRTQRLKSLALKDNLSLNLRVNPAVKMGRVMDIQAIIKSINYNNITSSIITK